MNQKSCTKFKIKINCCINRTCLLTKIIQVERKQTIFQSVIKYFIVRSMAKHRRHSYRESSKEAVSSSFEKRPSYAMEMHAFLIKEPKKELVLKLSYCNLVFFLSGILAICVYYLYPWTHSNKQLQHLPADHLLQVRDDFAIYAQSLKENDQQALKEFYVENGAAVVRLPKENMNVIEALGALKLAMDMFEAGKIDKAQKLFEHAFALAPKHPEILLRYGEFLEHSNRNIVLADQYYFQALIINPSFTEALTNRQRTATIVQNLDERRLMELDHKRDVLSGIHESNAALRRAKKEAYFQHIYHSVGIEGNTMTLAQTRSILETRTAVDGKSIDEHNEILGLDLAMKYINASLVNKMQITIKDILDIHRRVLGHVDPIEGGEFRRTQVYVGGHVPPGPGDLAILMRHFEDWLNSEQLLSMHPIKHAALAHYKLVHIHPFIDGNGRTSRLLMNTLLMRAGYPPVIIPKQQRHKYYQYLQLANEGDIRPFVRFIADCTERTLDLYLWVTSNLPQQIPMLEQTENTLDNIEKSVAATSTIQAARSGTSSEETLHRDHEMIENEDYFAQESGSAESS